MDGTSILSLAEWKTLQSSRTATASARPAEHQNDGTTIGNEGERLVGRIEEEHPLHTQERLSAAGPRPLTPSEVGHDVGRGERPGLPVPAVRRDEPELPVGLSGQGDEGRAMPPPAPGHAEHGAERRPTTAGRGRTARVTTAVSRAHRGRRPTRLADGTGRRAPSTARVVGRRRASPRVPAPHQPTRAAPISGPRSPRPPGTTRAPWAKSSRHNWSISAWAAPKKGSPKPSATEPLTTASGRSRRFTTDAMARPTSVPVRSTTSRRAPVGPAVP